MTLSGIQFRGLMNGLAELYRPDAGDFPARVIGVMRALTAADSYSYNLFAGERLLGVHVEPVEPVLPDAEAVFRTYAWQHPVLARYLATGDPAARRISDFLSDRQFRELALYREFYRHTGTNYQAGIAMPLPGGSLLAVAVNRQSRDFSDDETDLIDLLRPHVAQAAAVADVLSKPPLSALRDTGGAPVLTARQESIVRLVAAGHGDRQIARALGISPRTVHSHLQNIYRLLGVSSRTEALARLRAAALGT